MGSPPKSAVPVKYPATRTLPLPSTATAWPRSPPVAPARVAQRNSPPCGITSTRELAVPVAPRSSLTVSVGV